MSSLKPEKDQQVDNIVLTGHGAYDRLVVKKGPRPGAPREGHILVKVKACGANFCDLLARQGLYTFENVKPPFVMGIEASGIVEETASDVRDIKPGDRVMCWNFKYGMWTELACVPAANCMVVPETMSFEEAATLPIQYLTAYLAIVEFGNFSAGQSLLVQAAAGGVGWAATQIAKSVGNCTVFGTASNSKHSAVKQNGVDHPIDYRNKDFAQEVRKISPKGVDLILDCLAGSDLTKSLDLLKQMGRIITIGVSNMVTGEKVNWFRSAIVWWQTKNISPYNLIMGNQSVCGLNIHTLFEKDPQRFRDGLTALLKMYNDGLIKPKIDSIHSFQEIATATKRLVERENVGKVILVPRKED